MSGSVVEVIGPNTTTPRMGRRSMALADIDPKYVSQSGIWEASEVETSRGSIRIQHLTKPSVGTRTSSSSVGSIGCGTSSGMISLASSLSGAAGQALNNPRFPKLEECAHFHYDCVELPAIKVLVRDDPSKPITTTADDGQDKCAFSIEVVAGGQSWAIRRTHNNIQMLDSQLHRCVWDRTFSLLERVHQEDDQVVDHHNGCREFVTKYLSRLNELPTNKITCGTVLSWLELDNRGRHIVSSDDSAINTPAVAAACALRKYVAQAADEISFEVGEMISLIDMPPPEESIWWRGKLSSFHVGFFPRECVQVIGEKVPAGLPIVPSVRKLQRLSVSSSSSSSTSAPDKPVLRKHGKLIAFFRSFILSRPSRRRLKQSGILRERVFSCDLAEHLLNTGNEIPTVLKCCSEFIEAHGIVDGVYRLSGITSNIQKLRNAFDEDKIPNLEGDLAIKQDIHAVSSLLKMYFRELPNPLCTYQLYEKFVAAAKESDEERLLKMRDVCMELPPPHYRTLEYLMKHLSRIAARSTDTGMTPKNMAIVWAPNLIRCKELEAGGVAALKGIGVQAVVTEYLIRHADLIFNDKLPANFPATTTVLTHRSSGGRPKSLAISSPIKLMSLEEAQDKAKDDRKYIEVGGGPSNIPPKYHTVIELPGRRGLKNKRSPIQWKHLFSRNRSFSKPQRKTFTPGDISVITKSMPVAGPQGMQTNWAGRLRPVKSYGSVESLVSSPLYNTKSGENGAGGDNNCGRDLDPELVMEDMEASLSRSSPATPVNTDVDVMFHPPPNNPVDPRSLQSTKSHNRSISHDSYFEFGEFKNSNNVYIDETLEEETMSQSSKLSLDLSSSELESSAVNSPVRNGRSKSEERENRREPFKTPVTPPPSAASIRVQSTPVSTTSTSDAGVNNKRASLSTSPVFPNKNLSKWRDSEVQTSQLKLSDVGVCTDDYNIGTQTATSCLVEADRRPCILIDDEPGKYDLDKNSSFDESSEMSTPEEQFANTNMTNIIYSPLVNEISSTSSAEQFDLLQSSINSNVSSSASRLLYPSNSNRSSTEESLITSNNVVAAAANVCLFVCPLYEAGVTQNDFNNQTKDESKNEVEKTGNSGADSEEGVTARMDNNKITERKQENLYENQDMEVVADIPTQAEVLLAQTKEICHIYENERIYQNQPIVPLRKRTVGVTHQPSTILVENISYISGSDKENKLPAKTEITTTEALKPKAKEPLPSTCIESDSVYVDRSEEHYENISESHYEGNIYEDIESENEKHEQESKYSSGSCCRYEAVGDFQSSSRDSQKNDSSNLLQESSDDDEYSANYESVRFQKVEDKLVPHHYSAIEEKSPEITEEPKQDHSSSESNSRTEEIVTYLEVQTPSFNLRSNSLEGGQKSSEDDHSYESVGGGFKNSETDVISPTSESDEIHFIDSPLTVDNPVYALEMEGIDPETISKKIKVVDDDECDVSMNESISIHLSLEDHADETEKMNKPTKGEEDKSLKILGRCNSAPLADTRQDFVITDVLLNRQSNDNNRPSSSHEKESKTTLETSNNVSIRKMALSKRLSEPTLLLLSNSNSLSLKTDQCNSNGMGSWRLADAKRLAKCRKQSVKELLSKFESRDSTPSPTTNSSANSFNTLPQSKDSQGPGLPIPVMMSHSQLLKGTSGKKVSDVERTEKNRFQHHRFSVGDILLGPEAEDLGSIGSTESSSFRLKNSMIRSDTFPDLRSSNMKTTISPNKIQSASKENLTAGATTTTAEPVRNSRSSGSINEDTNPLVPEKVQHAVRVAILSSVDMNDPNTRERIEKYKEERRTFLRQKITTEIGGGSCQKSPSSNEDGQFSDCQEHFSSIETSSYTSQPLRNDSSIPFLTNHQNTTSVSATSSNNKSPSDSPRKRAFSEDTVTPLNEPPSYCTKTKSIKTEPDFVKYSENSEDTSVTKITTTQEEINVKEKIALWTVQKKEMSKSTLSCSEIHKSADPCHKPFVKPVLRREVTTSSIEISKCKLNVSRNEASGKKIKDMAAFFEAKRF